MSNCESVRATDLQQREGHWAIVDLRGKACHVRTVPVGLGLQPTE